MTTMRDICQAIADDWRTRGISCMESYRITDDLGRKLEVVISYETKPVVTPPQPYGCIKRRNERRNLS